MNAAFGMGAGPHGYHILFEDLNLHFPDAGSEVRLHNLNTRAEEFKSLNSGNPDLENSKHRIVITGGTPFVFDPDSAANSEHLREKTRRTGDPDSGFIIHKTSGGIFGFWSNARLLPKGGLRSRNWLFGTGAHPVRSGKAAGFDWPPKSPNIWRKRFDHWKAQLISQGFPKWLFSNSESAGVYRHGSPGRLQLIADVLLARAQSVRSDIATIHGCLIGATLATNASEMYGSGSPSSAVEALQLKHEFEVLLECHFSGSEYHFDVRSRLAEIEADTRHIVNWFSPGRFSKAHANSQMRVISRVVSVLRANAQFDEEQKCLGKIRKLHLRLWLDRLLVGPFKVFWPVFGIPLAYLGLLLSSFGWFSFLVACWLAGLTIAYNWAFGQPVLSADGLVEAFATFFGSGGTIAQDNFFRPALRIAVVNCVAIVAGAVHIGVLISYIFSSVMRR